MPSLFGGPRTVKIYSVEHSGQPQTMVIWVAKAGLAHGASHPRVGMDVGSSFGNMPGVVLDPLDRN